MFKSSILTALLLYSFAVVFAHEHSEENAVANKTSVNSTTDTGDSSNNSFPYKPALATDDERQTVVFGFPVDNGAITRMMYVLVGVTALLVLYFGVKIWR